MNALRSILVFAVLSAALNACSNGSVPLIADASREERADEGVAVDTARLDTARVDVATQVQMQNVDFYVDQDIPLRIRRLTGTMRNKTGGPVIFDDKRSFVIAVRAAEVGLTGRDLSLLLNRYVFNYAGSPLRNISITTSGPLIVQKGTLHKVFPMPFEIHAQLSVTPDGRIRIHPVRTEILGLHVDKLMKGLGLALDEVIDLKKAKGASVSG